MKMTREYIVFSILLYAVSCNGQLEKAFTAVWAVPSWQCKKIGINLDLDQYGIIFNEDETWQGNNIVIFNERFGLYPYFSDDGTAVNGGVPQLTNLTAHFEKVVEDILRLIPNESSTGFMVLDWEPWRPVWDRNWDSKKIYKDTSISLVREKHRDWPEDLIEMVAKYEFETAARVVMEGTLNLCKKLRPHALWGFYEFPKCYNGGKLNCTEKVMQENDELEWLFDASTAIFPSIYLSPKHADFKDFVVGELREAKRVIAKSRNPQIPIFPFSRFNYSRSGLYYTNVDLENTIGQSASEGVAGVVLWGDHFDGNNPLVCQNLKDYLDSMLGTYILNVTMFADNCSEMHCSNHGRCVRKGNCYKNCYHDNDVPNLDNSQVGKHVKLRYVPRKDSTKMLFNSNQVISMQSTSPGNHDNYECNCYPGWQGNHCDKN